MQPAKSLESNRNPLPTPKQTTSYPSDLLTPSEIEQLRKEMREADDYFRKAFAAKKPKFL